MSLIFVDVEAHLDSPCPGVGRGMTEFGAVEYATFDHFHGVFDKDLGWPPTMLAFEAWLNGYKGRPVFVSDNPAYDWQWINYHFHHALGRNPFGHSARRISDFYAGLCGDFRKTQEWKRLRVTKHDHDPVHDAMGNAEAFKRILEGER